MSESLPTAGLAGRVGRVWPALLNRHFRLLWVGMLPSTLSWQWSTVVTGYAALTLSDSAVALGLVASASGLPMLVLSPIGGVAADRFPRRRLLILTQSILGASAGVVAVLTLAGWLEVWHLVALGLAQGVAFSFNMPARQAYIGEILGPRLVRNAVAISNSGMNFNRIVGPPIAGILLASPLVGIGGVFALMTLLYGIAISTLFRLPSPPGARHDAPAGIGGAIEQLLEGLRFIRDSVPLRTLILTAMGILFFGMPYQQLMPLFSERVFEVGAVGLGTLMAGNGIGALVGSIGVSMLSGVRRQALLQITFGAGYGLGLVGFALAPTFSIAVVMLAIVGALSAAYTTSNNSLVMGNSEPRFHGRVMSIYLLTFAITPLSTLPMSWLSEHIGPRLTIAGAGAIVAAIALGVAALYPPYRRIR
ncbi:MAG: MFS transporter [Chloroflexota bacterium]